MSMVEETVPLDAQRLREDFPILGRSIHDNQPLVYLDNAATTQRPRQVIDCLVEMYEKHYANVHRGIHWLSDHSTERFEDARRKIQTFINAAESHEIVFTTGATASINLVARSWGDTNVKAGDEILVTEMEHHSNLVPWHQLAERTGCVTKFIPITDDGRLDLSRLDQLISERTRLVAVAAVSNVLGTENPLEEIISRSHEMGALVLVDAAQSVPHAATDVRSLDADFFAFSGHKMLGPSGVGILYGKEALLETMPPFLGGGSMIRRVRIDGFDPADLPAKFEAGTPPIVPAVGLGAAVDYLNEIGMDAIHQHEGLLTSRAYELMSAIQEVRLIGPSPEHRAGIISFVLERIHAHDVAELLDRRGIAIRAGHHCAMPLHKRLKITASNRASFYFYNTLDEVEQLVEAIQATIDFFQRKRKQP